MATFVRECVAKPVSNKRWIGVYLQPKLPEVIPPKMDMTMRLLVSKEVSNHDFWLTKLQALAMDAAGLLIGLIKGLVLTKNRF